MIKAYVLVQVQVGRSAKVTSEIARIESVFTGPGSGRTVRSAVDAGGRFGRATGVSPRHVRPPSVVARRVASRPSRTVIQA
jgi:hypothetical protein